MERAVGVAMIDGNEPEEAAGEPGPGWRIAYVCLAGTITLLAFGALLLAAGDMASPGGDAAPSWSGELLSMNNALAAGDLEAAGKAWQRAYRAALGDRGWKGMLAAGDAALRVGEAAGARETSRAQARGAYLVSLFRAQAQRSPEGAVQVGEAFAALGDGEAAEVCLRVAQGLVGRPTGGRAQDRTPDIRVRVTSN